jgi:hypothetical protein
MPTNIKSIKRGDYVMIHSPIRLGSWASGLFVVLETGEGGVSVVPAATLASGNNFRVDGEDIISVLRPQMVDATRLPTGRKMDLGIKAVVAAPTERPDEAARIKKAIAMAKRLHAVSVCDVPDPISGKARSYALVIPRELRVPGEPTEVHLQSVDGIPPGHTAKVRSYDRTGYRYVMVPESVLGDFINGTAGSFRIPDPGPDDFLGGKYATPPSLDE